MKQISESQHFKIKIKIKKKENQIPKSEKE